MSDKPEPRAEPLDLVIRARRGSLEAHERGALSQALATSATARLAHELGSDLDLVSRVQPGDEALIERALGEALTTRRGRRRSWRSLAFGLLAATLAIASAAAATRGMLAWRTGALGAARPAMVIAAKRTPGTRAPAAAPSQAEAPVKASETSSASSPPPPAPALTSGESNSSVPARVERAAAPTAATLFQEAGLARRGGDLVRARALYLELEARFPTSKEASVSRVSLGKLLLSAGRARDAEAAFAGYLRSGATDLRAEALVGRADALLALGRSAEERSVREELLLRYPTSLYASRARERIAEIDRADGTRGR